MDLGTYANQQLLIAVDGFSSWLWVFQLGASPITRQITASLCDILCASGAPDIIYTDQGAQFMSKECQDFFKRLGVGHVTSSPHFPQSYGRAEAAVKYIAEENHLPDVELPAGPSQQRSMYTCFCPVQEHTWCHGALSSTAAVRSQTSGPGASSSPVVCTGVAATSRRSRETPTGDPGTP